VRARRASLSNTAESAAAELVIGDKEEAAIRPKSFARRYRFRKVFIAVRCR
jgi:hypothetical protein